MKISIFEIGIYKYKVSNWDKKRKKLLDLFNGCEHKMLENVITSPINIKTNSFDEEIDIFEREVNLKFKMQEVWFQRYNHGMGHSSHNHGPRGFSAVCFIEYCKKSHNPTTFICPFENNIDGKKIKHIPDVEEGDIIFFPSNLFHYAPINISDKIRTIISFNLKIINNEIYYR